MSPELKKRIGSALVLAVVTLAATWMGGLAFRLLAALISLLVYYEWSRMTRLADTDFRGNALGWLATACVAINLVIGDEGLGVPLIGGFTITALLLKAIRGGTGWLAGGIFYSGLSAVALAAIRAADQPGFVAMLFIFAVVWATDILAYFVGRALRGPKLAPRISPGKTWSGAIGGTVSGVAAGGLVSLAFFPALPVRTLFLACLLSVMSQIGDLFESFIKRRFGVKDSSHLIPGHGGVMDRVDGLVFAGFTAFLLAILHAAWSEQVTPSVAAFLFGL
ncbi:phosphatidate cytidylyltransferase [Rhizobium sp. SSA_523]|uniref:phosphatidate cytidylyltransferase n=1 Tax=Rhizobium sp. SSA_523 TaxID=2952477 RepID=UPI0020908CC4|nr:phosphatidate cytidylyltransferase [Rhizobium sp. SSA_523]MCO5733918.1 phosphatidate cytidylyltransferase [Rhizobium sp. SSA_523]WKC24818.1 phosphatidate cytidylyltransferase [Rhizobium sp. SSA_523]